MWQRRDVPGGWSEVDHDRRDDDESDGGVVERVAAKSAFENDAEDGGEGDEGSDDVADFHGVRDEAAEEVSKEGEQRHGEEGDPGIGVFGGGAALEALVARDCEGEREDDHGGCGKLLERHGPGRVAEEEFAITLADVVEVNAGDVVVLAVDHQCALEREDEADGGEADDEGGEDAEVETFAGEGAGEFAE